MALQLVLIDDGDRDWRISERTKQIGRHGIAAARAALRNGARRPPLAATDDRETDGPRATRTAA